MKKIILGLILISQFSMAAEESTEGAQGNALLRNKTFLKNPMDLRDPFKRKISKKKSSSQSKTHEIGVYSNLTDKIEDKPIESIRIVGVLIGKDRRALAKILTGTTLGKDVYFIKEGMKIGPNAAEVKAILPGGVVLVEKIRNVYDQDEYLETVLPVSNE